MLSQWTVAIIVACITVGAVLGAIYFPQVDPGAPLAGSNAGFYAEPDTVTPEHKVGLRAAETVTPKYHNMYRIDMNSETGKTLVDAQAGLIGTTMTIVAFFRQSGSYSTWVSMWQRGSAHGDWTRLVTEKEFTTASTSQYSTFLVQSTNALRIFEVAEQFYKLHTYTVATDSWATTTYNMSADSNAWSNAQWTDLTPAEDANIYSLFRLEGTTLKKFDTNIPEWATVTGGTGLQRFNINGGYLAAINSAGTSVVTFAEGSTDSWSAYTALTGLTDATNAWISRDGQHLMVEFTDRMDLYRLISGTWTRTQDHHINTQTAKIHFHRGKNSYVQAQGDKVQWRNLYKTDKELLQYGNQHGANFSLDTVNDTIGTTGYTAAVLASTTRAVGEGAELLVYVRQD